MAMDTTVTFSRLLILATIYVIIKVVRFGSREKHLPPGPSTWPIIGNAHLVVDSNLYKRSKFVVVSQECKLIRLYRFKDWSEQYGEVYSLKIGKGTMIVLNSRRAVHELIDRRSAIYSARPHDDQFHMALKGENIANMDADNIWRTQRKITARFFAPLKLDGSLAKIAEAEYVSYESGYDCRSSQAFESNIY